jgi:hypothetical protein
MRSILLGVIGILAASMLWPQGVSPFSIPTASPLDRLLLVAYLALFATGGISVLFGLLQLVRLEHPGDKRRGRDRRKGERRKGDRRKEIQSEEERREAERVMQELGHDRRQAERRLAARREAERLELKLALEERRKRES